MVDEVERVRKIPGGSRVNDPSEPGFRRRNPQSRRKMAQLTTRRWTHTAQWALYEFDGRWLVRSCQITRGRADLDHVSDIIQYAPQFLGEDGLKIWIEENYLPDQSGFVNNRSIKRLRSLKKW